MKTIQIKTLELLLIKALHSKNFSNDKLYTSFRYMLNHFSDEDYLYAFNHRRIISVIYLENFYAHRTVKALTQYLHMDNKTLLSYRKAYLKLFAKQYMDLVSFRKTDFLLLYSVLSEDLQVNSLVSWFGIRSKNRPWTSKSSEPFYLCAFIRL